MSTTQTTTLLGWVIDRDYINGQDDVPSRVGIGATLEETTSPVIDRGYKSSQIKDPVRFRLLDDDGEIYYGGAIDRSWIDGDEHLCFSPLEYGTADAGATELQYTYSDGQWRTL